MHCFGVGCFRGRVVWSPILLWISLQGTGAGMTQGPLQLAYRKPSNVPALLGTVWEDPCRQGSCRELDPLTVGSQAGEVVSS